MKKFNPAFKCTRLLKEAQKRIHELDQQLQQLEKENKELRGWNKAVNAAYESKMRFLDRQHGHGSTFLRVAVNDEKYEEKQRAASDVDWTIPLFK